MHIVNSSPYEFGDCQRYHRLKRNRHRSNSNVVDQTLNFHPYKVRRSLPAIQMAVAPLLGPSLLYCEPPPPNILHLRSVCVWGEGGREVETSRLPYPSIPVPGLFLLAPASLLFFNWKIFRNSPISPPFRPLFSHLSYTFRPLFSRAPTLLPPSSCNAVPR